MAITGSGAIRLDADILVELGQGNEDGGGLKDASIGGIATINTANPSADRPDGSAPHLMSEFYSYDHSASLGGNYGNSAPNVLFSSSKPGLQLYNINIAGTDYAGSSVIGATGHIYFRMDSTNDYRQDAQLVSIDYDGGGYHGVGSPFDSTWGYSQWKTTSQTTNTSYNHSATWSTVVSGSTAGKWNYDTGNTPSGSTGQDSGSSGCIYYEGSGSSAYYKDVYLRSKEVTFQSNTIKTKWYHYGSGFSNPARIYMGIYIT